MAVKPETTFRLSVEKYLPPTLYRLKLNLPYTGGVPDSWYSGKARDLWVEYKYIKKLPVRPETPIKVDLSVLQIQWLTERNKEGRNTLVIVGCSAGGVFLPPRYWAESLSHKEFIALVNTRKHVANVIYEFVTGETL